MDIGVYTHQAVFNHKRNDGIVYWRLSKTPKVESGDKLWFATLGKWRGYFIIEEITLHDRTTSNGCDIDFDGDSWVYIKEEIPRKPFQGFTYKVPKIDTGGNEDV